MLNDFLQNNNQVKKVPYDWTLFYLRKKALTQKIEKEELQSKLEFEIKPLLMEYVKDGILNETEQVKTVMNELISKDFTE